MFKFKMIKTQHTCIKRIKHYRFSTYKRYHLKCQTNKFYLINTCQKGVITGLQKIRPVINNKKHKTKGANWNAWETDLTSSLNKYLNINVTLNSKSTIDLLISNLTKIINDTAQKSLGIIKNGSLSKSC